MHREDLHSRLPASGRTYPRSVPESSSSDEEGTGDPDEPAASFLESIGPEETTPVSEIMARKVFCATPEMTLATIACAMLDQAISGAPVVDSAGRPIGIISKTDLLRAMHDPSVLGFSSWDPWRDSQKPHGREDARSLEVLSRRTALDAMTPIVYWLPEEASISQAAALMAYEHVHRIPIVNHSGKVTGLVSTLDILRWLARRRGYLIPR